MRIKTYTDITPEEIKMTEFEDVRNILKVWASQVKGARGTVIADVTINAIERISKCFKLSTKFTDYIYEYRTREGALQSIIDYREHFIHPFHVFCLGYFILDKWRESYPNNVIFTSIDKNENICLNKWFIASIYHDVGYPSEKFEKLVKEFFKSSVGRELKSQFDWSPVFLANENIEHIRELSKLFENKNNNEIKIFEKWLYKRIAEDHDHGVLSALMLLNVPDIDKTIALEAALAISIHSWKRPKEPDSVFDLDQLKLTDFPLAFFLNYCDTAQEWGRKVLLELSSKERISANTDKRDYDKLDDVIVKTNGAEVVIKYGSKWEDKRNGDKNLKEVFKETGTTMENTWLIYRTNLDFKICGIDNENVGNNTTIAPTKK